MVMGREGVRTITKKDLYERIAEKTGASRTAVRYMLQTLLDEVVEELGRGNRIEFRDFGVFEVKIRAPRVARNPREEQPIFVPERKSVKFKPGKGMRNAVERGQAPTRPILPAVPLPEPKPDAGLAGKPDTSSLGEQIPTRQS